MKENSFPVSLRRRISGWLIHAFTASGAVIGLMALMAIYHQEYIAAFWLMGLTTIIDAMDGFFARSVGIKEAVPSVDGELLDNIVDFFTYSLLPAFFVLATPLVPNEWRIVCVIAIVFASAYQFTQKDAKTSDHFFKGFPSYWNIVVFYLFFWQLSPITNVCILLVLSVLSFVPIKYVYLSRLDYLTHHKGLRIGMAVAGLLWGIATLGLIWVYPESNKLLVFISVGYCIFYCMVSLYRTWKPLT